MKTIVLATNAIIVAADLLTDLELSRDRMNEDCPILNTLIEGAKIHSESNLHYESIKSADESLKRCYWNGTYFECTQEDAQNIKTQLEVAVNDLAEEDQVYVRTFWAGEYAKCCINPPATELVAAMEHSQIVIGDPWWALDELDDAYFAIKEAMQTEQAGTMLAAFKNLTRTQDLSQFDGHGPCYELEKVHKDFLATEGGQTLHKDIVKAVSDTVQCIQARKAGYLEINEEWYGLLAEDWQNVTNSYESDLKDTEWERQYAEEMSYLTYTDEFETFEATFKNLTTTEEGQKAVTETSELWNTIAESYDFSDGLPIEEE